tara:strand:+ start:128 stop:319 length:192 start_codon:yes stop_codon:yes gene_type:complete
MSFLDSIFTPNKLRGLITLEKSLFDKLLSPINLKLFFEAEHNPIIHLASVPEFPAFKTVFFLF